MNEAVYQNFKSRVLAGGKPIGDGQCVSLIVNNPDSYTAELFPGVTWENIIAPVAAALEMAGKSNQYLTWVDNDHGDPNQLPPVGAIMVFGATGQDAPEYAGGPYLNTFDNPDGHAGICDSADTNGYSLLQQNSPKPDAAPNVTHYVWKFRPCLGWFILTPKQSEPAQPAPAAPILIGDTGKTLHLDQNNTPFHLYNENGPFIPSAVKMVNGEPAIIVPAIFPGGIDYTIVRDLGMGIYVVDTEDFGLGALWTQGSNITISQ